MFNRNGGNGGNGNGNGLVKKNNSSSVSPVLDVPNGVGLPVYDIFNPDLTFYDVFQPAYLSAEYVEKLVEANGNMPIFYMVEACTVEYIFDPEKGELSGEWKPVLHLAGTESKIVLNKTRAQICAGIVRSMRVADWGRVGRIEVWAGMDKATRKYQLLLRSATPPVAEQGGGEVGDAVGRANDDLF